MSVILAIDLAKVKSLFCWHDVVTGSQRWRNICSTPQAFHDALTREQVERVIIEVCDMAGWIKDLCERLQIPLQIANGNTEGWRWRNVKKKTDKDDTLKLVSLSVTNQLPTVTLPDRPTRQWKSLILYRQKLIERRTRIKNRIHAIQVSEGRAISGGRQAWSEASLAQLCRLAKPIADCAKDDLWQGQLHMELSGLDDLNHAVGQLDQRLDGLGQADARVIRLQTIPGVGPRLSEL